MFSYWYQMFLEWIWVCIDLKVIIGFVLGISFDSPDIYLKEIKSTENQSSFLELWPVFDLFVTVGGVNMH